MVRPMVHSEKHYLQNSLFTVAAGAVANQDVVRAVQVLNKNASFEVEEGSSVKAIYFEYWLNTNDTSAGSNIVTITKVPAGGVLPNTSTMVALASYVNKKNVLWTGQGLTNPNTSTAIPVLRQWVKIPKSKQRMGLDDRIVVSFFVQTGTLKACGFTTYKEYK